MATEKPAQMTTEQERAEILRLASKYDARVAAATEGRRRRLQHKDTATVATHIRMDQQDKLHKPPENMFASAPMKYSVFSKPQNLEEGRDEVAAETLARRKFEEISGERAPRAADDYGVAGIGISGSEMGDGTSALKGEVSKDGAVKESENKDDGAGSAIVDEVLRGEVIDTKEQNASEDKEPQMPTSDLDRERLLIIAAAEKYELRKRTGAEKRKKMKEEIRVHGAVMTKRRKRRLSITNSFDESPLPSSKSVRKTMPRKSASQICSRNEQQSTSAMLPIYSPDMPDDTPGEGDADGQGQQANHQASGTSDEDVFRDCLDSKPPATKESGSTSIATPPASGRTYLAKS